MAAETLTWLDQATDLIRLYVERTDGAYVEGGANYVAFNFGHASRHPSIHST